MAKQDQVVTLRLERLAKRMKLASSTPEERVVLSQQIDALTAQIEALEP